MPTPEKILARKLKKREKKKLNLVNKKANGVSNEEQGNITSNSYLFLVYIATYLIL